MVGIEIQCPVCSTSGTIELNENFIRKSERGISAINIAEDLICKHSFVAYIDKNFKVRDCFLTDFKLETPEMDIEQFVEEKIVPSQDMIDLFLITNNFNAIWLSYILHSCFYKKKILLLDVPDQLQFNLSKLFKFIFQNTFEFNISFEKGEVYRKEKKRYEDYIIFEENDLINDKYKIVNPKNINLERTIIQKFLAENDSKTSLILLRNEIHKVYDLSNRVIELNNNLKHNEELTSKKIIDYFEDEKGIKIQIEYLDFLFTVIENYFNFKLAMSSKTSDFFGF
ncbi:MAG: hypothetical protein GF353_22845 [Candidatus Lokiarchaeota archaeon]|nr:hypothetical protein [Candidatus Lokiarchaeota archaeon]